MFTTLLKLIAKLTAKIGQYAPNTESMSSVEEFADKTEKGDNSE